MVAFELCDGSIKYIIYMLEVETHIRVCTSSVICMSSNLKTKENKTPLCLCSLKIKLTNQLIYIRCLRSWIFFLWPGYSILHNLRIINGFHAIDSSVCSLFTYEYYYPYDEKNIWQKFGFVFSPQLAKKSSRVKGMYSQ